jgi:hypothetical protein
VIIDVGGGGLGGVSYVGVSSTFENGLRPILLMNYLVGTEGFVAISPDGQRVLLRQYWDGQYRGMYLWDVVGANTRQQFSALGSPLILKDIPIAGATFLHDRNRLLVITDIGLVQYEVDRRTSTLMYPGLDTSWVDWALFSPDAHYVAVLTHPALDTLGSQHTCLVYVLVLNGQTITPPGRSHPCHSYG